MLVEELNESNFLNIKMASAFHQMKLCEFKTAFRQARIVLKKHHVCIISSAYE